MSQIPETPFDSIESAHQYIDLLLEAIEEAQREIDADISVAARNRVKRRQEALRLVAHNLGQLALHTKKSRRLLNDLRTLRRLLLEERQLRETEKAARAASAG